MSRYGGRRHEAPCQPCCDGDCGGVPVFPVAPRQTRLALLWKVLLWFVIFLVGSVIGGTFGAIVQKCEAQSVQIDTSTAQYRQFRPQVDSLVTGPFMRWVRWFALPHWKITIQADSLSVETAETYINETYRNALIRMDMRRMRNADVDEVFVHELFHIKLSPYTTFVTNYIDGHGESIVSAHLRLNEERLVTDLTRTLSRRRRPE